MLRALPLNTMMTTKNCGIAPEAPTPTIHTAAERMAHARAAKAAKAERNLRRPQDDGYRAPPPTTGVAHPSVGDGTPSANWSLIASTGNTRLVPSPTTAALQTILRELGTMFSHATPRGQELVAQALALLPQ